MGEHERTLSPAVSKTKKSPATMPAAKTAPSHPTYEKMIKATLVALKDRTGSSSQAIVKYMKANYDLPENFSKILSRFLKQYVENGKLVKVKASYKLGSLKTEPKLKKKVVKKKTTAPKKKAPKKKAPKKKKVVKKK